MKNYPTHREDAINRVSTTAYRVSPHRPFPKSVYLQVQIGRYINLQYKYTVFILVIIRHGDFIVAIKFHFRICLHIICDDGALKKNCCTNTITTTPTEIPASDLRFILLFGVCSILIKG